MNHFFGGRGGVCSSDFYIPTIENDSIKQGGQQRKGRHANYYQNVDGYSFNRSPLAILSECYSGFEAIMDDR